MSLAHITNAVLVVTCSIITIGIAAHWRDQPQVGPPAPVPYRAGDNLGATLPSEMIDGVRRTLILYEHSQCPFSRASVPFYRRLQSHLAGSNTRFFAVTPEDVAANRTFLSSNALRAEGVFRLKDVKLSNLNATPALVLVRNDGVVIGSWVGRLTSGDEKQVLRAIGTK
jgi:hypothetical protein